MGYFVTLDSAKFTIRADRKPAALDALRLMWLDPEAAMSGGSYTPGQPPARFFAWMNLSSLSRGECQTFEQGMDDWGWPVELDDAGNVIGIDHELEKIGDEAQMFDAIAPFVDAGCFIAMHGEDGAMWRWYFDGDRMVVQPGHVLYE